jgi:hypothetical protein
MDLKGSDCSWFPLKNKHVTIVVAHFLKKSLTNCPILIRSFPLEVGHRKKRHWWTLQHLPHQTYKCPQNPIFLGVSIIVYILFSKLKLSDNFPQDLWKLTTQWTCHSDCSWLLMQSLDSSSYPLNWSLKSNIKSSIRLLKLIMQWNCLL